MLALAEPVALGFGLRPRRAAYELQVPGRSQSVRLRPYTSDFEVFVHVFVEKAYRHVDVAEPVGSIIDCGANIGLAAFDLLDRFPDAHLVAVEPDAGNFDLLKRNLQSQAHRVTFIRGGIWSGHGYAVRDEVLWRDGREWSFRVRPAGPNEHGEIELISIPTLLERQHWTGVDLVKMDIEGAELEVFQHGSSDWLARTRVLAVELHDTECEGAFQTAILPFPFSISRVGELTVATRQLRSV